VNHETNAKKKALQQQLDELIRTVGPNHSEVANCLNELGIIDYENSHLSEAELLLLRALAIFEQTQGPDHPDTADALQNLAWLYRDQGQYAQAITFLRRVLAISEQAVGSDHPETAGILNCLAELHLKLGQHVKAEPLFWRALAINEQALGHDHPYIAVTLNNLGLVYQAQGQLDQAEPLFWRSLAVNEQALGPDHPDTASALCNLGINYKHQDQLAKAEPLFRRALAINEKALAPEHPNTLETLDNLAQLYRDQGKYNIAKQLFRQYLAIQEQALGPDHPGTCHALNKLGLLYRDQGQYALAEPLFQKALAIQVHAVGIDHPDTANFSNSLGSLYQDQGQYLQAKPLFQRALAIYEHTLGTDHPETSVVLDNLACLYHAQGCYAEAEPYFQRALEIREHAVGADHPDTAFVLNNLASLYQAQRRYIEAERRFRQSLAIIEKALGPDHPHTANALNNLGLLCRIQFKHAEAGPLLRQSLAISEKALGPDHPATARTLNNLATLHRSQGQFAQAEPLFQRVLSINTHALGADHPATATALNNLAFLYQAQGRSTQAEPLFRRSLAISKQALGPDHPNTATTLNNLASLYQDQGQYAQAEKYLRQTLESYTHLFFRELPLLPTQHRLAFIHASSSSRSDVFRLAVVHPPAVELALWTRLNRHGLLQEIERRHQALLCRQDLEPRLLQRLSELINTLSTPAHHPEQRRRLRDERERLERRLYEQVPDLALPLITAEQVASALPPGSALVEIEHVATLDRYLALLLRRDAPVQLIDLGCSSELNAMIEAALFSTSTDLADADEQWAAVSQRLIGPLLLPLSDIDHWFLSLDGALHRVPMAALPWPDGSNCWLNDAKRMTILTSGRDLLELERRAPKAERSVVIANPSFDLRMPPTSELEREPGWRSRDIDLVARWSPLPGTAEEGQRVAELLAAQLLSEADATTANLQRKARPRILHAATHGYFLPDQPQPHSDEVRQRIGEPGPLRSFQGEDPMLRSGLVLAGANHPDANPHDDGYLTAMEAAHLNLQGTELVTLSACDTGRGDVLTGEGVYGLQRALIVAGARSTLLSLWKVPDDATCAFMVRFYRLLKEGTDRFQALITVQREFRAHPNPLWRSPCYWAAWQLVGDWRPIEGL